MKILILGLDGATFDLILPWVEQGHLPNLGRLIGEGTHGELRSTLPPVTSPAWPTFMTGCNPGKHGVFDFIQPNGTNYSLVNATRLQQPTIWQMLSNKGYRVGVLNVPVTYPPQPVNGFMVSGILSPKRGEISYPSDLIERYAPTLGEYRIAPKVQYKRGSEAAYIDDIYSLIDAHGKWALHLMEHEPVDVMMVHFIALDLMSHALWRLMDTTHPQHEPSPFQHAIRDGYKRVDGWIGRFLDLISPETDVLVMSDHGFGPLHGIVNLNNFLLEKGFLKLNRKPVTQLKALAFKYGVSPASIYRQIEKIGLQNIATRVSKNTRNQVLGKFLNYDNVDWSRTIAYSMGHVGQIYLNMIGREPHGIVSVENYLATRQAVVDALRTLTDDEGRPIVTDIILREETYHGDYTDQGPDIHLILDDYNIIAYPLFATNGEIVTEQIRGDSGCHRREGILIAHGEQLGDGDIEDADILDLAPTIFALLGEPVPEHIDGNVLTDLFSESIVVETEALDDLATQDAEKLSDADRQAVEDRLRSLGYL